MDMSHRLAVSYYKTIATINESHNIYLVQHMQTNRIYIKKLLDVYNLNIYEHLYNHPIIGTPRIIDYCEIDNQLVIIEEYISGTPLYELIAKHSLSESDTAKYMLDLCNILETLHSQNPPVIHRDIKPHNIIITNYNNAVLLDFNAAKNFNPIEKEDTVLLGTQGYAAPEQYGFGASSPLTDIYSLGIVLKEMLIACNSNSDVLSSIADKCTKISPEERYLSINALKRELISFTKSSAKKQSLIPPGYRTRTPWKMFFASLSYLYLLWACLSMKTENTYGTALWIDRIFFLFLFLIVILLSFNYLNIHEYFPLHNHKNKIYKYFGIVATNISVVFFLATILYVIKKLCHM